MYRAVARLPLAIFVLSLPVLLPSSALGIAPGVKAPAFSVQSGDGRKLTRADPIGRVAIILYETRNATNQNDTLRAELEHLFAYTPVIRKNSLLYVVINCSSAVWPLTLIWKEKLVAHSIKEHVTIYGDWDGKMSRDYAMVDNTANLVVLDKSGIVRYFYAGLLGSGEIKNLKNLLHELSTQS